MMIWIKMFYFKISMVYRVIRNSALNAISDMKSIYTPITWTVGWLGRVITQVIFFAVIGILLDSQEAVLYLFIGQSLMAIVTECYMAIPSTTWERRLGTLPLLVASPAPIFPVFFGRSLQWIPSGIATASITLLLIGPFFGVHWNFSQIIILLPSLLLVSFCAYSIALTFAAFVLRIPAWRNIVANVSTLITMILSGATVPISYWPSWVQTISNFLPVTPAISMVRSIHQNKDFYDLLQPFLSAVILSIIWYFFSYLAFIYFSYHGRKTGSIDFEY